jgi:hypothetical protein
MSGYNPYQPPTPVYPPAHSPATGEWPAQDAPRPTVWWFFAAYCAAMALLYLSVSVLGVVFIAFAEEMVEGDPNSTSAEPMLMGAMFIVMGLIFGAFFAAAPLLPKRKWAWIYGIVVISIGLTSICTLLASIPLLIFWIKDDVKAFYQMPITKYPGAPTYPGYPAGTPYM